MIRILRTLGTWITSAAIAFIIVFLLKTFVGMPTKIKGTSMYPTFLSDERIILSTWNATFDEVPKRGDCITFEAPSVDYIINADLSNPVAIYNSETKSLFDKVMYKGLGITKSSYIKRVIGLPGEHVEIKNGKVYINGKELKEDYLSKAITTDTSLGGEFYDIIVPDGYVYVLGDNRGASSDSRRFGCIPVNKIEGKAWIRWWPLKKFGTV